MTPDQTDPQATLRAVTDQAAETRRARLAEIEADRSTPGEDLLADAAINAAGAPGKTQTEVAAERRAAEMRAAEAAASKRTPADALAAHTVEEAAKTAPEGVAPGGPVSAEDATPPAEDPATFTGGQDGVDPEPVPDPPTPAEEKARGTVYRVLRLVNLVDPDASGDENVVPAWVEVGDVTAPNRDAAVKSVAMAMIENAMREGATLVEAFAQVESTLFAAPPASSFVAVPANPTINLRVG